MSPTRRPAEGNSEDHSGPASRRVRQVSCLALALVVALAVLLRTVPLRTSHAWDEAVFLQHAMVMVDGRNNYDEFHHRPPALSALYALGLAIRDHIHTAHLVQGLASGLACLFGFLFAQRLLGRPAGLAAAVALAFTPYLVQVSSDLLTDVPVLTAILAAMWLFERGRPRDDVLAGVLFGVAILTRYTATFFGFYFLLAALAAPGRWRSLPAFGAAAAATLAPYLYWNWRHFGDPVFPMAHARRIVTEWAAPMPVDLYVQGLSTIFPAVLWVLFAVGLLALLADLARSWRRHANRGAWLASLRRSPPLRQGIILFAWGIAFFIYMAAIPHKEVRYLLPLALPVIVIGALGFDRLRRLAIARGLALRLGGLAMAAALLMPAFAPTFQRLGQAWVDDSEWEAVRIARFLREASSASDVVYAAHEFPVLAFYSGRTTVSLLPVQQAFERRWRHYMNRAGLFVHYHPETIGETHGLTSRFKPDQAFIDTHPRTFQLIQRFARASVYRYRPEPAGR